GDAGGYLLCAMAAIETADGGSSGASLAGVVDVASEFGIVMQSPSALYTTAQTKLFVEGKGILMSSSTIASESESAWFLGLPASPTKVVETTDPGGKQVMAAVTPMSPAGWSLGIQV